MRNFDVLRDEEEKQRELTIKLEETLTRLNQTDVDSLNDEIVDAVQRSVEEVCSPIEEMKKKEPLEN